MTSGGIQFREIVAVDDPLFPAFLDAYETCFPANEREPVSKLLRTLLERKAETNRQVFLAGESERSLATMAKYTLFPATGMAYLTYMAVVDPAHRGRGLGTLTFQEILRRIGVEQSNASGLILEIDDPAKYRDDPAAEAIAERRIRFYRHQGVKLLAGIRYNQTVEFFPAGTPMLIGVLPRDQITAEWVFARAVDLFGFDVEQTGALVLV
jgi:GNAT superfamily N-acetyltransferase